MSSNIEDEELFCPQEKEATFELFPTICNNNQECESLGKKFRCCKLFGSQRCHEGLEKPLEDDLNHERELQKSIKKVYEIFNKFQ